MTGLPTDDITALAIDRSTTPGIIYVGTGEDGVFVSEDGGNTWTSFNEGLGNLSITKLAISASLPKMLYAGTAYGGVWSRTAGGCPNCGDVNLDDDLTPGDALVAFQHYLAIADPPLDPCQLDQADVTQDDDITPADALCIFQRYLAIPSCLDNRPECPWD